MRAGVAVKLTVEQRLGFEITLARTRIERGYEAIQSQIHDGAKVSDAAMVELHEAEQILAALERVSGDFYRRHLADMKAYREEQKQHAKDATEEALDAASHTGDNE